MTVLKVRIWQFQGSHRVVPIICCDLSPPITTAFPAIYHNPPHLAR